MLKLAYSISSELKDKLISADLLRGKILTSPLSPKLELKLRWEATTERLHSLALLSGNTLNKSQIIDLLISRKKNYAPQASEIFIMKTTMDYLIGEWTGSSKAVTTNTVENLISMIVYSRKDNAVREFRKTEKQSAELLEYLSTQKDHPLIQAALVHYQFVTEPAFTGDRGRLGRLLSFLFLLKFGFDVRGLVVPEKEWRLTRDAYEHAIESSAKGGQLTPFLEYIVNHYLISLEECLKDIARARFQTELPAAFWELNDRERQILSFLEYPEIMVTNRKAQKMFKISQITASRDLSKLAALGLIVAHGKGRSVAYSRV